EIVRTTTTTGASSCGPTTEIETRHFDRGTLDLVSETDAAGVATSYLYDARGNRIQTIVDGAAGMHGLDLDGDPATPEVNELVSCAWFNEWSQPLATLSPDGELTTYGYGTPSAAGAGVPQTVTHDRTQQRNATGSCGVNPPVVQQAVVSTLVSCDATPCGAGA